MQMNKEDLIEYFETYIKQYAPFKNYNVFQILLNYLVNNYYDDLYNVEPQIFKKMFEENIIPEEVYDKLLVSIGLPNFLIETLTFNSKVIFLKTFSDFQRYKSSISFIENLGVSYDDYLGIYELYIDYSDSQQEWILRPKKIYKHRLVDEIKSTIKYNDVVPQIPTVLVDVQQLSALKDNGQLTLPLKSNLILLDYELTENVSSLYNLIFVAFIKSYKDLPIELYFSDFNYSYSIEKIVFLWHYLLSKYYKTTWKSFSLNYIMLFDTKVNTFTINDLDDMIIQHDQIQNRKDFEEFHKEYFSMFERFYRNKNEFTEEDFHKVINVLDRNLIKYLDERISKSDNQRKIIQDITSEIYNSVLLNIEKSKDELYKKYSEYYLLSLSQLVVNPRNTDTFTILYNLKPYHTELVARSGTLLKIQDNFNRVFVEQGIIYFNYEITNVSMETLSDVYDFNYRMVVSDSLPLLTATYFNIEYDTKIKEYKYIISDHLEKYKLTFFRYDDEICDDKYISSSFTKREKTKMELNESKIINFKRGPHFDKLSVNEGLSYVNLNNKFESLNILTDKINSINFKKEPVYDNLSINEGTNHITLDNNFENTIIIQDGVKSIDLTKTHIDQISLTDSFEIIGGSDEP